AIAVTHTASLVGDDAAYDALFDRLGIRRVHSLPELLDTLAVLGTLGPLGGSRLVSLSCSGGEAAMVADRSRGRGLSFPPFAPDHADQVASALEGRVAVTNPLDYHTFIWGDEARLTGCFKAALGADGPQSTPAPFDAALLVLDFPADGLDRSRWWPTLDAFSEACAATSTPGVVAASLAENLPEEARARSAKLGLAACGDIDTALSALEAAAVWGEQTGNPMSLPDQPNEAGPGCTALPEYESKRRLGAAGVAVPAGGPVPAGEAAAAADRLGYPVVVKTVDAVHKTDTDGVVVGIEDPEEVAAAARRLAGDNETVMVESCVTGAVAELLVSVRSAPPVGMLLTIGAGGTLAELLDDTVSLLLPASADDVRQALRGLRIWPMLAGHRGRPAAAVEAVVGVIDALGALVRDDRSIIEIEINPLIVTNEAAVAADALMLLAEPPGHG
ncbi:MAG: acetate--CoA ligase family protein, partial [Acidobacteria bacterium]|nr:acetate--CoA ligase family protein [Acidobacteriota bacterium]